MSQAESTQLIVSFFQKSEALKRELKNSNASKKLTSLLLKRQPFRRSKNFKSSSILLKVAS